LQQFDVDGQMICDVTNTSPFHTFWHFFVKKDNTGQYQQSIDAKQKCAAWRTKFGTTFSFIIKTVPNFITSSHQQSFTLLSSSILCTRNVSINLQAQSYS